MFFYVQCGLLLELVARFGLDDLLVALEGDLIVEGFCDGEDQVVKFDWKRGLWLSLCEEVRRYLGDFGY